jgi:uncharacterized protein YggE
MNTNRLLPVGALLLLAPFLLVSACSNGETTVITGEAPMETGITVSGTGEASAAPDMATIDLGIEAFAATVAEARDRAARAASSLIASVKANGVADRDIQTRQVGVNPVYDYSRPGQPVITGYSVSNILTVRVRDLDRLSRVIDDAIAAGGEAVRVNGLQFGFGDREALLETARKNAIADARKRAETYAAAAGVRLGDVLAISETAVSGPVPLAVPRAAATGDSTPIEPGESTITVSVTVRFALER